MASDSTSGFSPFGYALFGIGFVALLFFAFLMTERGDGRNPGRIDSAQEMADRSQSAYGDHHEHSQAMQRIEAERFPRPE